MDVTGYIILGFGILALGISYILYKVVNMPMKTFVTARELDYLWTAVGKMMVEVDENNVSKSFLKDLDDLIGKCFRYLNRESKNTYAESNKKQLKVRLRELHVELVRAKAPYKVEIRKHRLQNLAKLVGMQVPKRRI